MPNPCSRGGCLNDAVAKELCRSHYERERGRHRHRNDRILHNRARSQALTILRRRHPEEFTALEAECYLRICEENDRVFDELAPVAQPAEEPIRLKPGPKPVDEEPLDRVSLATVQCKTCRSFHDRGHKCPACEVMAREGRVPPAADDAKTRIARLLISGKSAGWIVDQGFPRADVTEVMRELTKQARLKRIEDRNINA